MIRNKLLKDSTWNAIDYISTLIIFLVSTKLLISEFGASGYGFYTFFISLVGFFGMVDMGMGMAVSKYLSEFLKTKDYYRSSQVINVALLFYLSVTSIIVAIVYVFSTQILAFLGFDSIYLDAGPPVFKLVSIIFVINLVISIPVNVFVALEKWVTISVVNIIYKILSAVALIYILFTNVEVTDKFVRIFSMMLMVSILKLITLLFLLKISKVFQHQFTFPSSEIRLKVTSFLRYSSLQYFLSLLVGHLDKFIISRFFGLESLGIYSFCVQAFAYLYGLIANSLKIFYPKLAHLHGDNDRFKLKAGFIRLLFLSFTISLAVSACLFSFWKILVTLYLDAEFASASYYYITFFALFLVVRSPEVVMYYFFNATANPKMLVRNLVIGAPITFGLYFILVPFLGVVGLIISQILGAVMVYTWHLYKFRTKGFESHAFS